MLLLVHWRAAAVSECSARMFLLLQLVQMLCCGESDEPAETCRWRSLNRDLSEPQNICYCHQALKMCILGTVGGHKPPNIINKVCCGGGGNFKVGSFTSFFLHVLGSPLDFFHTPATTPSQPETIAMALSTAAACSRIQTLSPACSITPLTPSPVAEWIQKRPAPAEWALISPDSVADSETKMGVGFREAVGSPPSVDSWQERDSGLEPQAAEERVTEVTPLGLLRLMERYRASVEVTSHSDATTGAAGMF